MSLYARSGHKFRHQEMLSWREYIPYKNPNTNNGAEQALLTVWKPGHDRERAETGNMSNSNGRNKNTDTDIGIF